MPAATLDVTVTRDDWVLGVENGKKGLFSNPSPFRIYYRKANSKPASEVLIGHTMEDGENANVDLTSPTETGNIYYRLKPNCHAPQIDCVFTEA